MPKERTKRQKLLSRAGREYRKWQHSLTDDFIKEQEKRRVHFAETEASGKPPVPVKKLRERAEEAHRKAVAELHSYESKCKLTRSTEEEIAQAAEENSDKGRRKADRAVYVQKYIRRISREIERVSAAPEEDFIGGERGRPKMGRLERIKHLTRLLDKANEELLDLYAEMSHSGRLWHQLHDAKSELRQVRIALKTPENDQAQYWVKTYGKEGLETHIEYVIAKVAKLEKQLEVAKLMEDAGEDVDMQTLSERTSDVISTESHIYAKSLKQMIKHRLEVIKLEEEAKNLGIDVARIRKAAEIKD